MRQWMNGWMDRLIHFSCIPFPLGVWFQTKPRELSKKIEKKTTNHLTWRLFLPLCIVVPVLHCIAFASTCRISKSKQPAYIPLKNRSIHNCPHYNKHSRVGCVLCFFFSPIALWLSVFLHNTELYYSCCFLVGLSLLLLGTGHGRPVQSMELIQAGLDYQSQTIRHHNPQTLGQARGAQGKLSPRQRQIFADAQISVNVYGPAQEARIQGRRV